MLGPHCTGEPGGAVNDVERLAGLREDLDRMGQRWARTAPRESQQGTAANGTVAVTVDASGTVTKVVVREAWRDAVDGSALGAAVLTAYAKAGEAQLATWGERSRADEQEPEPVAAPAPPASETFADSLQRFVDERGNGPEVHEAFDRLGDLIQQVLDGLDESARIVEERMSATYLGTDSERKVRVLVRGSGELVGVEVDQRWLEQRHSANVTTRLTEAVRAAYRTAAEAVPAGGLAGTPLGEVTALLDDPGALLDAISRREA